MSRTAQIGRKKKEKVIIIEEKKKLEIRKSFARIEEKYILPAPGKRNGPSDYGE